MERASTKEEWEGDARETLLSINQGGGGLGDYLQSPKRPFLSFGQMARKKPPEISRGERCPIPGN